MQKVGSGTNIWNVRSGTTKQGWEFALSIFWSSLFRSRLSLKKSDFEWFALVALKKRSTVSQSLLSLFTKERPRAKSFCRALQKSDHERIAPVALYKRVIRSGQSWQKSKGSDSLFFTSKSLFSSFDHKNRAIPSKNRWSNYQPCTTTSSRNPFHVKWHGSATW